MTSKRARLREQFWSPEWDHYKGYAINFIKENKWRCDPTLDKFEDLIQDCWIVFDRVKRAYPRVVEPEHFMALFKTALFNEFATKSRNQYRRNEYTYHPAKDVSEFYVGRIGEAGNAGYATALLQEMPEEMKMVLDLAINPTKVHHRESLSKHGLKQRDNLNGKISRHMKRLGIDLVDPLGTLAGHFRT